MKYICVLLVLFAVKAMGQQTYMKEGHLMLAVNGHEFIVNRTPVTQSMIDSVKFAMGVPPPYYVTQRLICYGDGYWVKWELETKGFDGNDTSKTAIYSTNIIVPQSQIDKTKISEYNKAIRCMWVIKDFYDGTTQRLITQ